MNIRDKVQGKLVKEFVDSDKRGIIHAAMRLGKCRVGLRVVKELKPKKVLICYPDNKIKDSWIEELTKFPIAKSVKFDYINYRSLHKVTEEYDLILLDEIHATSEKQKYQLSDLLDSGVSVLGLTGTLSNDSLSELYTLVGLPVISKYSVEEAIEDGILPDYEIHVHQVPLDNRNKYYSGKRKGKAVKLTEKEKFDVYSWVLGPKNPRPPVGQALFTMRLKRMDVIKKSISKKKKLDSLLKNYKDERVLVFTGLTKRADKTSKSHHSKNAKHDNIDKFINEEVNHLTVVGIGGAGVTYKNLDRVIVEHINSNSEDFEQKIARCLNNEYKGKKAIIDLIITTEPAERKWVESALQNIKKSRLKWI